MPNSRKFEMVLPDEWHEALQRHANKMGVSKGEAVRYALLQMFPASTRKKLPEVKNGRPKGK